MNSCELTQAKMEAILGSDSEPYKTFLKDHRKSSEEAKSMFNLIKEKEPNSLALKLAAFLESTHDLYYREECAELLHKLFTDDDDLWQNRLSVSTQSRIKFFLLHLLPLEESAYIILELCLTVAPLAVSFLPNNNWPELLPFLYHSLTDPTSNNDLKEEVMIKYLKKIVKMVLHSFQDPHPRVRWAAISATLQLSIDFCPDFQEQYHTKVLPALAASMDDFQNPRLQAEAALAIQWYFKSEKTETLVPYLDKILNKLLVILQNDNQMVKEKALQALSFIVHFSKEDFLKYYDCVMPYLKTIIVNANDKYNHILRQYALECISLVVMDVSKGKFRDDLEQLMEVLIKSLHKSQVKELDTIVYGFQACYRVCFYIGKDFLPYMSTVMPPLIECAQLEPDKTVSSDESIHKVEFGDQIILARGKNLLEGKAKACLALGKFAWRLEEDFYHGFPRLLQY